METLPSFIKPKPVLLASPAKLSDAKSGRIYFSDFFSVSTEKLAAYGAYVHDYGGEGGHLNYGIALSERKVSVVTSRFCWLLIRTACRLLGESPFLKDLQLK